MATRLYLIRHGLAAARGDAYPDDGKRPLTGRGVAGLRREARGLAALGVTLDQVLTSPLVRARQTAELMATDLGAAPVANVASLAPGGKYQDVLDDLARYARRTHVALVGHEPDISELARRLLGVRGAMPFKKGAVCCIEFDALPPTRPGHLLWFATPKLLRRIR
jgi:phosphohistidine phosphatase